MNRILFGLAALFCASPLANPVFAAPSTSSPYVNAATPACTLYVSPTGSASNSGTTPATALSLAGSFTYAVAGDVVCIEPGMYYVKRTLYPGHNGNANARIVYTNYGAGAAYLKWQGGGTSDANMIHFWAKSFPNGPSYLEFDGLTLDGQNVAENGFFCQNSHHLTFRNNTIINQGSSGIGSMMCDYLTSDHNTIWHNGYVGGWSSGISYNSNQWLDNYSGFHNIVANNIIAGQYDASSNHSDGNGIIMDTSNDTYNPSSANTPPALIVNNVVYENGGRCIENYIVTNIWTVNNTCYANGLDLSLGSVGSIVSAYANNEYFVNNLVQSWNNRPAYSVYGSGTPGILNIVLSHNLYYGGSLQGTTGTGVHASYWTHANPLFTYPPPLNATADGQYRNALNPSKLGNDLVVKSTSPALGKGIDPTKLTSNSNLVKDMSAYVYASINGKARPKGGPFTLGAY